MSFSPLPESLRLLGSEDGCWAISHLTWLILPVVICLFQRLSHASLSISFYTAKLRIAHYNSYNSHDDHYQMDIHGNSGANTCKNTKLYGMVAFISLRTNQVFILVSGDHNDRADRIHCDSSFKFLTYQLPSVGYWPTEAVTGNGELGFDSGEGAWETATTSKDGSRRANYPIPTRGGSDQK